MDREIYVDQENGKENEDGEHLEINDIKLKDVNKIDDLKAFLAQELTKINEQEEQEAMKSLDTLTNELISANEFTAAPNWINYLISVSIGCEAIPIGYCLVIGPVFIMTKFKDQNTKDIGLLYGTGTLIAGIGALLQKQLNDKVGHNIKNVKMRSPYDSILLIFLLGVLTFVLGFAPFNLFVVTIITMFILNDNATLQLYRI